MSKISHLAERLKSQIEQEREALESQTSDALNQHAKNLKQLLIDDLSITKAAIKSESDQLIEVTKTAKTQAEAHISKLPSLLMMSMLWPILTTIALCSLVIALTWLWLPEALFSAKTETWTMSNNRKATVIISQDWTICTHNNRQYPCRFNQ